MIDRQARRRASELLRHLGAGLIANDQFEDRFPTASEDVAIDEIRSQAWFLYSDLREYRLAGKHRLAADARREVARWILFLQSDLEYEWPTWNNHSADA